MARRAIRRVPAGAGCGATGGQEGGAGGAPRGARPRHVQGILTASSSGAANVPDTRRRDGTLGDVTGLDWIIVGLVLLLALFGWAQGFLTGALALAGLALGAFAGTRIGPLAAVRRRPLAVRAAVRAARRAAARRAPRRAVRGVRRAPAQAARATAGRVGGRRAARRGARGCAGLGVVWILGAFAVQRGGYELREEVRRSSILQRLNTMLPPSGPLLNSLARLDPFPRIDGPEADVAPPRRAIRRDRTVQGAAGSVAKILGTACGLGVEGSGWVAGPGLVVTNAHVVAGQRDTRVLLRGRGAGPARRGGVVRRPQRPRHPARGRARRAGPAARPVAGVGHLRGDPRLPAQRPVRRPPGPGGGHAQRDLLRRLRARAGPAPDDLAARATCARATRAARWWTAPGAWSRPSSPPPRAGPAAATACRTASCGGRWTASAAAGGTVSTGPCAR